MSNFKNFNNPEDLLKEIFNTLTSGVPEEMFNPSSMKKDKENVNKENLFNMFPFMFGDMNDSEYMKEILLDTLTEEDIDKQIAFLQELKKEFKNKDSKVQLEQELQQAIQDKNMLKQKLSELNGELLKSLSNPSRSQEYHIQMMNIHKQIAIYDNKIKEIQAKLYK